MPGPCHGGDTPRALERLRQRVRETVEEADEAGLVAAELALVALREPLERGPMVVLLKHLADQLEAAAEREDDELRRLRRLAVEQAQEIDRLRGRR